MTLPDDVRPSPDFPGWDPAFQATIGRLSLVARRPATSPHPGAIRSTARGRAIEFADYRPYVAGDELRLVDWRVYARLDRLYVKRHDDERERSLTLLVDASASLDFGDGEAHKGTYARRLAAALTWIGLSHHDPVHAWVLREGRAQRLAPAFVASDAPRLVRALGSVREGGGTGLAAAVRAALASRPRGPVVLLSDLLDPGWPEALRALAPHEAAVLQVLAPEEWEPALGEEVELEDAESGERVSARMGPAELVAYRGRLDAFLSEVADEARRHGILHVALRSDDSLAEAVLRRLPAEGLLVS